MAGPPNDQYGIVGSRLGFRLGYLTADLRAIRETHVIYRLDDQPVKIRVGSVTVHDIINDSPDTCALTIDAKTPPTVGQRLVIKVNSNAPRLLFAGALQTVGLSYEGRPAQNVYPSTAIDDTPGANRKLPYGAWSNASASIVAQWLLDNFAPGYSGAGIQPNLPAVSVNFDSTEGMDGCLRQLAKLIGGYFYWEDKVLHLFTEEAGNTPDPIDDVHNFLDDPAIASSLDTSQVRTRVYGKGYAEEIRADVAAGDAIVPISNTVMFNPAGGKAVTETQRLAYTGTTPGGGGSLVGPGIGPAAAPILALQDGAGVTPGQHSYAVTFLTAAGESLLSPLAAIAVGLRAAPAPPPTIGNPAYAASGVDPGTHQYAYSEVTASGETAPSALTPYTVRNLTDPTIAPVWNGTRDSAWMAASGPWQAGANVQFQYSYSNGVADNAWPNETNLSPASSPVTLQQAAGAPAGTYNRPNIVVPPSADPSVKYITLWGFVPGVQFVAVWCGSANNVYPGNSPTIPGGALITATYPGPNPTLKSVPVTIPATADPAVTGRRLYRTAAGGTQLKLVQAIGVAATTINDVTTDAALGANALATGTAAAGKVSITAIPIGASTVTGRKIYRTAAGLSQLKFLATLADNTTTTYLDTILDANLGANAPTADTSGLKQPDGVVLAGAASIVVAGAGWATAGGGWAIIGNGQQTIRYTAIAGNTLTGIPAIGPGAITATVSYGSTITASPALLGVSGLVRAVIRGAPINLWVQRDDTAAQSQLAAIDHSDGIIEHLITDERRGETSLAQLCDADLEQYSQPIQTVAYATRDTKTKSGKPIVFNLATPAIHATLTIQEVTITELDIAPRLAPKFTATASSVRFSLDDILRRLGAFTDITT